MRVRLIYTQTDGYDAGSRFYLSYSGASPTSGNCATLASDIASSWSSELADQICEDYALTEVDVLDIASVSGNFGHWTGSESATRSGTALPAQSAMNVEFDIGRRYRGGKPRMFLPPGVTSDTLDAGHWGSAYIGSVNTNIAAFFSAIEALSIGAVGTLQHVNLSYYSGFKNLPNSSGRERAVPTYRASALVDPITGYSAKGLIGSQRRRRAATTP